MNLTALFPNQLKNNPSNANIQEKKVLQPQLNVLPASKVDTFELASTQNRSGQYFDVPLLLSELPRNHQKYFVEEGLKAVRRRTFLPELTNKPSGVRKISLPLDAAWFELLIKARNRTNHEMQSLASQELMWVGVTNHLDAKMDYFKLVTENASIEDLRAYEPLKSINSQWDLDRRKSQLTLGIQIIHRENPQSPWLAFGDESDHSFYTRALADCLIP